VVIFYLQKAHKKNSMETIELGVRKKTSRTLPSFNELYKKAFPPVATFVSKMNGSFQDAKDIFHDAMVIFYEKTEDASFVLSTSAEAYVTGIAKHLWIKKFKRDLRIISLDAVEARIVIPEDYYPTINTNRLLQLLESAGRKCLDLLHSFYHEKLSGEEIKNRFGYKTEHSASVQKYKCIEKIRETIQQKAITYENFFE
jgi:DNA-directed RNA polymerase specialized sigma24 family protein